jgi:tRNA(Ile)-lysidine synthase
MVLNVVRGAGLKGLSGMKPVSPLPLSRHCEERSDVAILRPLLTFTRKQIEGHAFAWKVPYREDKTNSSTEYRRNSIRHEVFPLFERMNPSYVRTLNREMTYFKDASDIVDQWCKEQCDHIIVRSCHHEEGRSPDVLISTPALLAIPQWRYLLYYILEPYGFNSATLESLESLLTSDRTLSGKRFESEEYVLYIERDTLEIYKKVAVQAVIPDLIGDPFMVARIPGTYHVNGSRIVVETLPWTPDMPLRQSEGTIILDAAKLRFPFVLRKWRSGDWMIPLGMKGKKKISDLFTDLKYSHAQKECSVIVVDVKGDLAELQHVAGVAGVRIDDRYKVTDNTETIIRITIS